MATSLRLPSEMEAEIDQLAKKHHRSTHGEILHAIERYIEQEKEVEKMAEQQACVISVAIGPDPEENEAREKFLHEMFNYVQSGESPDGGYEFICAGPRGLSYDEAFIICQRSFFSVGWVYANAVM